MQLVIDVSVLVGEVLRLSGRRRMHNLSLELFSAEHTLDEARYEVGRRVDILATPASDAATLRKDLRVVALDAMESAVQPVFTHLFRPLKSEALRRCPRDPNDWQVIAAALALRCGIWTADNDFLGCGVATWTTETIDLWLGARAESVS